MKYYLAEACQNTFVLLDCLSAPFQDESLVKKAHLYLKKENRDDALILSNARLEGDAIYARMIVVGLDGSLGEFCGNGSRACAAYLFQRYPGIRKFYLTTPWGIHPLSLHDDGLYSIKLPQPRLEINKKFISDPEQFKHWGGFHYVEMIEPHLIIENEMSDENLLVLGQELNQQKELFPLGINLNAWHQTGKEAIQVKTYERGVQRLTRSCGTGSMACASYFKKQGIVHTTTPGGSLEIHMLADGIVLKGPASYFDKDKIEKQG